jgi:hypothetical protein
MGAAEMTVDQMMAATSPNALLGDSNDVDTSRAFTLEKDQKETGKLLVITAEVKP